MSLLHFPVEILLNIFGRDFDIASIENIKKVHPRFRQIISRYKLDVRPARKLSIARCAANSRPYPIVWKIEAEIYEEMYSRSFLKYIYIGFNDLSRTETAQIIRNGLKDLSINSVEALHLMDTWFYLDTNLVFNNSGIHFSNLSECIKTNSEGKLPFLNDHFIGNAVIGRAPKLNFAKCQTAITPLAVVKAMEEIFSGIHRINWHLGTIQAVAEEIEKAKFMSLLRKPIDCRVEINNSEKICTIFRMTEDVILYQLIVFGYQ